MELLEAASPSADARAAAGAYDPEDPALDDVERFFAACARVPDYDARLSTLALRVSFPDALRDLDVRGRAAKGSGRTSHRSRLSRDTPVSQSLTSVTLT